MICKFSAVAEYVLHRGVGDQWTEQLNAVTFASWCSKYWFVKLVKW